MNTEEDGYSSPCTYLRATAANVCAVKTHCSYPKES